MKADITQPSDRDKAILKMVIEDFVDTAHPVASKRLKEEYNLELSPATIRNTLHFLEEVGLLSHIHTSSGRIPTDFGYRFYVDELLESKVASESMRQIAMDELAAASFNVERLFQITANSLAQLNHLFGFAILLVDSRRKLTNLDLVKLSSGQVLLVLGFKSEKVRTVLLNLSLEIKDSLIEMVASILRERLIGLSVSDITKTIGNRLRGQSIFESEIIQVIIENAEDYFSVSSEDEIFSSTKDQLWQHPEFSEPDNMQSMINALDNSKTIRSSVDMSAESASLTVAIGSENSAQSMHSCSVVTKSMVLGENSACFGVIGPTRMNYAEVLTVLDLFASTIEKLNHA